jgi:hypothetical protein
MSCGGERAHRPAAGESRVVFLGDSITDYWKLPDYFPGKPYLNRGIDGQTTPEMLVRFRQDVIVGAKCERTLVDTQPIFISR